MPASSQLVDYAFCIWLTITIELLVTLAANAVFFRHPAQHVALVVIAVNMVSHPIAWMALVNFEQSYWLIETAVVLFEAAVIYLASEFDMRVAILLSVLANVASALTGWV